MIPTYISILKKCVIKNRKYTQYHEQATTKYHKATNIRILIFVDKNEFTSKTFYLFLNSYVSKIPIIIFIEKRENVCMRRFKN